MIDKCYQEMIETITGNASDRDQLLIIENLVLSLRDWQDVYMEEGSVEELYYNNLNKILDIIKETLEKEDKMNEKRDMERLSKQIS